MFISSSVSRVLEVSSVNHTSIYENLQLYVFKNIESLEEISGSWTNCLLVIDIYKTFENLPHNLS